MSKTAKKQRSNSGSKVRGRPFVKGDKRICSDGAAKSKGHQVQNYFRAWLEATPDGLDCSRLDTLLTYLWDIASAANKQSVDAIKLLLERGYGKPMQPITGDLNVNATVSMSQWAARMNGKAIPKAGK